MELYFLVAGLGMVSGFLSGLIGIGGGIVMAPLLLYVPPLFHLTALPMKTVAGLTIVQGLAGCLSGAFFHRRLRFVSGSLALYMGLTIFVAALIGGAGSGLVSDSILLFIFAMLALSASLLMVLPVRGDTEAPNIEELSFSHARAVSAAAGVGLLGGLVGQGGSFILIPLMTSFVRIPTRIAIGSNLAIVFLASIAGVIGKAATGQIDWLLALPIVLTVLPAARMGSLASRKTPVRGLRLILALLIAVASIRIWVSVFSA